MALPFDKGEAFARDKPALHPCPNLVGHGCTIHDRLEPAGYRGCVLYDCLGAGQRVVQEVFAGADWQADATLRAPMAEALGILRRIHAALELLVTAESLTLPEALAQERQTLIAIFHPEARWSPESLRGFAVSGADARLRGFLAALRPHVAPP